jgi:hypothetical protein
VSAECPRNPFGGRSQDDPLRVKLLARKEASKSHCYVYDVLLEGEVIVSGSRDPEPDLARALLPRGHFGLIDVIGARTGKRRSRVNIEKAARLQTIEGPNGPFWRKYQTLTDQGCVPEMQLRGKEVATSVLSGLEGLSVG